MTRLVSFWKVKYLSYFDIVFAIPTSVPLQLSPQGCTPTERDCTKQVLNKYQVNKQIHAQTNAVGLHLRTLTLQLTPLISNE